MFRSKGRIEKEKKVKEKITNLRKRENKNRVRNKTVAFRLSEEEYQLLEDLVSSSGLVKQDYILQALLNHEVNYLGSPKMALGISNKLEELLSKIESIEIDPNLIEELIYIEKISELYLEIRKEKALNPKE